jgi:predicted DNA-binding transcriptional regulator AlpA
MKHNHKRDESIAATVSSIDRLPDSAYLPDRVIAAWMHCSVGQVWNMAKNGGLPKPYKISANMTRWVLGSYFAERDR